MGQAGHLLYSSISYRRILYLVFSGLPGFAVVEVRKAGRVRGLVRTRSRPPERSVWLGLSFLASGFLRIGL